MNSTEQQQLIVERIRTIIDNGYDDIFAKFDQLHSKGIHDNDVVAALRELHETDLLDGYAEWADIDLRDPEDRIPDTPVPDPGTNPSDLQMAAAMVKAAASPALSTPALDAFIAARPSPEQEIQALGNEYLARFHTDAAFHHKAVMAGRMLVQLERMYGSGDPQRFGFLIAAALDKGVQQ